MAAALQPDPMLAALARLRAAMLADASLAAALLEIWRPQTFAARVAEVASERGVGIDADQIADLLTMPRMRAPARLDIAAPPGWLPAAVARRDGVMEVSWVCFGARRLTKPDYEASLVEVAPRPFNRLFGFTTPLPTSPPPGALAPAGFIFHMSRCGSTLASQMLAACEAHIVVAEAPAIDQVVRADQDREGEGARAAQLRAIVGAFGQPRSDAERRLFIKLDSWHACALPLFRRAFPATPWVFVHRDPTEVLVSLQRRPSFLVTPDLVTPAFLGVDWDGAAPDADYVARVLGSICESALADLDSGGLVVSYDELPAAVWTRILPHFGVRPTPEDIRAMQAAAARDAKQPARAFQADSAEKQAAASEAIRRAVDRRLADVSARLARAGQSGAGQP